MVTVSQCDRLLFRWDTPLIPKVSGKHKHQLTNGDSSPSLPLSLTHSLTHTHTHTHTQNALSSIKVIPSGWAIPTIHSPHFL